MALLHGEGWPLVMKRSTKGKRRGVEEVEKGVSHETTNSRRLEYMR